MLLAFLCFAPVTESFSAAGESSEIPGIIRISVDQKGVSAELVHADLKKVLAVLSEKAEVRIQTGPGIGGRVTMSFADLPLEEAIERLSQSRAIVWEYLSDEKAYRVLQAGLYARSKVQGRKAEPSPKRSGTPATDAGQDSATTPFRSTASIAIRAPEEEIPLLDRQGRLLYKPGELLVQLSPAAASEAVERLHEIIGSRVLRHYSRRRLQQIAVAPGLPVAEAIMHYRESGLVETVERHALRYANLVPDDPLYDDLWGMEKISAPQAWELQTGDADVIVAVIDTGVDYLHPDLSGNIWDNAAEIVGDRKDNDRNGYVDDKYGYDFANNDGFPLDSSASGHGTHVAGTIAAVGNNTTGVAGVAWTARIMVLKVQSDGSSLLESAAIIEAVDYAAANGAKVVNCSFGGEATSDLERQAFEDLEAAGVLALCAAGNEGNDIDIAGNALYPAAYDMPNILSVAASTQSDNLAYFSNWGQTNVDLMAPGVAIKSTVPSDDSTEAFVQSDTDHFPAIGMLFAGTTTEAGVTATLIDCGLGRITEIPDTVAGNIALIERGDLFFSEKVENVQSKGAVGAVIYNNVVDSLDQNGGTLQAPHDPPWIPAVSISLADGQLLLSRLGEPVTLVNRSLSATEAYSYLQGTSMAAPMVAGAAALLYAADPGLSYTDAKSALMNYAEPVPSEAEKTVSGGRLNVWAAVCSLSHVRGDVSCDGSVDLADAIRGLQVLSGETVGVCSPCAASVDVDWNLRIGMPEVMYVLQHVAGLR